MSPPGHHHLPKPPGLGLKNEEPAKIPKPMCPKKLQTMLDCIAQKGNQHECRYIIRDYNECLWKMNFLLE